MERIRVHRPAGQATRAERVAAEAVRRGYDLADAMTEEQLKNLLRKRGSLKGRRIA